MDRASRCAALVTRSELDGLELQLCVLSSIGRGSSGSGILNLNLLMISLFFINSIACGY